MTEFNRLLDEDATDLERRLLNSAAEERPNATLEAKMLMGLSAAGVGAGAAAATGQAGAAAEMAAGSEVAATSGAAAGGTTTGGTATGGAAAGQAVGWGAVAKWSTGLLVVGALFVAGQAWMDDPDSESTSASQRVESSPSQDDATDAAPSEAAVPPRGASPSETQESEGDAASVQAPSRKDGAKTPSPKVKQTARRAPATSTLPKEVAALDRVRSALAQDEPQRALRLIQNYRKRYPRGDLRQEATVLEVRALEAQGDRDEASDLKEDFLQQHPDSAHRKRLESE